MRNSNSTKIQISTRKIGKQNKENEEKILDNNIKNEELLNTIRIQIEIITEEMTKNTKKNNEILQQKDEEIKSLRDQCNKTNTQFMEFIQKSDILKQQKKNVKERIEKAQIEFEEKKRIHYINIKMN